MPVEKGKGHLVNVLSVSVLHEWLCYDGCLWFVRGKLYLKGMMHNHVVFMEHVLTYYSCRIPKKSSIEALIFTLSLYKYIYKFAYLVDNLRTLTSF